MKTLIEVLERSVANHGPNKPLTIGWLLNLMKMAAKIEEGRDESIHTQAIEATTTYDSLYGKVEG